VVQERERAQGDRGTRLGRERCKSTGKESKDRSTWGTSLDSRSTIRIPGGRAAGMCSKDHRTSGSPDDKTADSTAGTPDDSSADSLNGSLDDSQDDRSGGSFRFAAARSAVGTLGERRPAARSLEALDAARPPHSEPRRAGTAARPLSARRRTTVQDV